MLHKAFKSQFIKVQRARKAKMADHLIQKGQTLSTIAQQYNVSIDTLMKLNPQLKNPNSIMAGASLKISQDVPTAKAEKTIKGAEL